MVPKTHMYTNPTIYIKKKIFAMKQENIRSSNRDKTGTISQNNAPRNMKITTYQIARIKANDVVALIWQSLQLGPDPVKMKTTHVWENKHFSWWPFICSLLLLLGIFGYRQAGGTKMYLSFISRQCLLVEIVECLRSVLLSTCLWSLTGFMTIILIVKYGECAKPMNGALWSTRALQ